MSVDEVKLQNRCDQNVECVCVLVFVMVWRGWERWCCSLAISDIRKQHNRQQNNNNDKYIRRHKMRASKKKEYETNKQKNEQQSGDDEDDGRTRSYRDLRSYFSAG